MDMRAEVKKSIEQCISARAIVSYFDCKGCVYFPNASCKFLLMKDALEQIKQMEREIATAKNEAKQVSEDNERLREAYDAMHRDLERMARERDRSRGGTENRT